MIIRCEQCSTTYELDEGLLDPEGSDVECSRCHHLFTARPPPGAGQTLVGVPAVRPALPSPPVPERPAARAEPVPAKAPAAPSASAARPPARSMPPGRGPSVYRPAGAPASSMQPGAARAPLLRRDTVGAFESRLRWSHRWRWLAPALVVLLAVAGAGVFFLRRQNPIAGAGKAHAHALELAQRDDVASLEEAGAELDGALRAAPGVGAARADRALVDLLLAGTLTEGTRSPEQQERTRQLATRAAEVLDQLDREGVAVAEVARARAVAAALGQDRATVARLAAAARARLADDPQVEIAERGAEVRAADRGVRDRAVGALGMLVARRPELLRARYLLARGQGLAGRKVEALSTLDGLLRANPKHEGAAALRAELSASTRPLAAPVAAEAAPPPVAVSPAPREERGPNLLPRKQGAQAEPAGGAGGGPTAGAAPPVARSPAPRPGPTPAPAVAPAAASTGAAMESADRPAAEPEATSPPSRLRPAAVPEPEPVQGGG